MPEAMRIIPLGGLGEVGKNMTVYEYGDDAIVVDAGLAFPTDEHLGVDLILPDFTYLRDRGGLCARSSSRTPRGSRRRAAVPAPRGARGRGLGNPPDLGLVKSKLDEHGLLRAAELRELDPEAGRSSSAAFRLGVRPDGALRPGRRRRRARDRGGASAAHRRLEARPHPVDGLRTDVGRLAEIGNRGVDLLLGDSTNAERPGVTGSERLVGEAFRQIIPQRTGRVLVASFASNVHRMQQATDVAVEVGRKVCVVGRSMRKNLNIARNLGYIDMPEDVLIRPVELDEYEPGEVLILCTGSQGEPLSALVAHRLRRPPGRARRSGRHRDHLGAARPGNELRVHDAINQLAKLGAEVLHQENAPVHVSGHGTPRSCGR
jgi:ribonuclease J